MGAELKTDAVIPLLFAEIFPPVVAGFLGIAILSAIMSTADGLLVSLAVIFSNDLYRKTLAPIIHSRKSIEEIDRTALWILRLATLGAALVAAILAWDPPEFLAVLLWVGVGGIMSGAAGPLLIGSLWKRATKNGSIASFLTGVFLHAYYAYSWTVGAVQDPFRAAGLCVVMASIVMVSLFTKPMSEKQLQEIFGTN